jgi:hypothetical protein
MGWLENHPAAFAALLLAALALLVAAAVRWLTAQDLQDLD